MSASDGGLLLVAGATLALPWQAAAGSAARWDPRRRRGAVSLPPASRLAIAAGAAAIAGVVSWAVLTLPILTLLAAAGAGASPFLQARSRAAARGREAERAWSAALDQLADGLEVGLAFPAAVALIAENGPTVLRGRFEAMLAPLRRGELEPAIATLAAAPERTAHSAAVLLRAALVEVPAGGLSPLLRELARVARGRFESSERARIRSLALRREATVLALSPFAFLLLIGWSSPGYLDAYRTLAGTLVSLAAAGAIGGCYLAMLRLGRVPGSGPVIENVGGELVALAGLGVLALSPAAVDAARARTRLLAARGTAVARRTAWLEHRLGATRERLALAGEGKTLLRYHLDQLICAASLGAIPVVLASALEGARAPLWIALPGAAGGLFVPGIALRRALARRREAVLLALPDALAMLTLSLAAGRSLYQAFVLAARETPGPLGSDIHSALSLARRDGALDERGALVEVARRGGEPNLVRFAELLAAKESPDVDFLRREADQARAEHNRLLEQAADRAYLAMQAPLAPLLTVLVLLVSYGFLHVLDQAT